MRDRTAPQGPKGRNGQGGRPRPRTHQAGKRYSFPWINAQIIAASESGGLPHLVSTIMAYLPQMNLVNLSTAVHRLAKLTANDPKAQVELRQHPALEELLKAIAAAFGCLDASEAQPQSLSNVAWSLATMRLMNRPLIQVVAALSVANISCFKPFELSTMLWAFAKLGTVDSASWCAKPLFHTAATHIMKHVEHFGFRCLATTAWAFATARQRHARLFRSIAAQMVPMVHAANCQEMANTAWAFGTADFHDDQLFSELADKALLRLEEFKPQELSNMLWGFATNGFFQEAFFTSCAHVAQRMDLQAQHLANIMWAFARVRPRHPVTQTTILALLPLCTSQLSTFKPQEVSSTALAVAKSFGIGDDLDRAQPLPMPPRGIMLPLPQQVIDFFGAVVPWAVPRLREFSAQSLANTVSAYAMVQSVPGCGALFAAIGAEVLGRYDSLEPTAMLHLLKGFSAVPLQAGGGVTQALAAGVARHVEELRPQELQTLLRICAGPAGARRGVDPTAAELRCCCLALANGEVAILPVMMPCAEVSRAMCGGVPMSAGWPDPRLMDEVIDGFVHVPMMAQDLGVPMVPCLGPDAHGLVALLPCAGGYVDANDMVVHGLCAIPAHGGTYLAMQAAFADPSQYVDPNCDKVYARHNGGARYQEFSGHTPLCTINESGRMGMVGAVEMHPYPIVLGPGGQPMIVPDLQRAPVHCGMPLLAGQDLLPCEMGAVDEMSSPQVMPFMDYQMRGRVGGNVRGRQPASIPGGHMDFQWRCSVKNSFLHVELSDNSDDEPDDSWDGGSSQRSSSVPSRFDREEQHEVRAAQDWHRRHPDMAQQHFNTRHPDLDGLDFD